MNHVRLNELLGYIAQGRIMDGMREFYAEDVVMEEPLYGKTVGLAANLAREEKFVASVQEFRKFEVPRQATGENCALYENEMEWVGVDGKEYRIQQVSVQTWRDGKIVHERFYYSMG
jgi:ketosteroid isomerase-like protein